MGVEGIEAFSGLSPGVYSNVPSFEKERRAIHISRNNFVKIEDDSQSIQKIPVL